MSTSAAKRRRIDAASHTLSKPFRSPLKTPFKSPVPAAPSLIDNSPTVTPISSSDAAKISKPMLSASAKTIISLPTPSVNTPIRTPRAKSTFSSPISTAALNADPDIAPLLRTQRELEKQLREVKEELEIADQARKIEAESERKRPGGEVDDELMELTEKWKLASRQAAEELFGKVRDRVNRMGGPRAWKEMQKKQQELQSGWNQEEQNGNNKDSDEEDGNGENMEKRDLYAQYDVDPETENEKSQRANVAGDTGEDPGQEDEFTMAMMLRTLNVDLKAIGYDREQQRWAD